MLKSGVGFLFRAAGLLILGIGLALSLISARMHETLGDARPYVWGLAALMLVIGPLLAKFGRQLGAQSGESVMANSGQIITYLRSFVDDASADRRASQLNVQQSLTGNGVRSLATEEEQIALAFADAGPLVAIGRPGERLPQLGAARMYVDDDSWQNKVIEMLDRSNVVLMRAGETDGFWWEIARVREHIQPARVIILLPSTSDQYERFRARITPYLPYPLPDFQPGSGIGSFGGLLWFESDWTPHVEASKAPFNTFRHPIAADLRRMAETPLAALGVTRAPPTAIATRLAAAIADVVILSAPAVGYLMIDSYVDLPDWATIVAFIIMGAALLTEVTPLRASPGKWLLGLQVADTEGFKPRLTQLVARLILRPLAWLLWYVNLPLVLVGKRTFHDMIAATSVFETGRSRLSRR